MHVWGSTRPQPSAVSVKGQREADAGNVFWTGCALVGIVQGVALWLVAPAPDTENKAMLHSRGELVRAASVW